MAVNTVTINGNVGSVSEMREYNGKPVVNFSVAYTPSIRQADGSYADGETTWYKVAAWGNLALRVAASVEKGARVVVIGHGAKSDAYLGKETGEIVQQTALTADSVAIEIPFIKGDSAPKVSAVSGAKAMA